MQLIKLNLRPGTQFHLGRQVPFDQSVLHSSDIQIHSDTLFSALVNIADKMGCADKVAQDLRENRMSSAYYLMENSKHVPVYFLPRPTIPLINCDDSYKFVKQKIFVSKGIIKKGISLRQWKSQAENGQLITGKNWIATVDEMQTLLGDAYDKVKAGEIKLFDMANIPQVKVHTTEIENTYYQTGNLQIADNRLLFDDLLIHYYFLVHEPPGEELLKAIKLLPLEGIGGQRSTGCGQVQSVSVTEINLFDSISGDSFLGLSKIVPTPQEIKQMSENTFYQTTLRGGRILKRVTDEEGTTIERLKQVRMIDEGAVFEKHITGSIPDLRPSGKVPYLRYGKSFLIPFPKSMIYA